MHTMKKEIIGQWVVPTIIIAFAVAGRLLPHPANVAPVGAIAFFAGLYLPKRWALIAPLVVMFISDIFIGFYNPFMMLFVYGGFVVMGYIGLRVRTHKTVINTIGGVVMGSSLFFLLTNWSVWAFGTMYTKTFSGLLQSYIMAIPFFRNSMIGDVFFVVVLCAIAELSLAITQSRSRRVASRTA